MLVILFFWVGFLLWKIIRVLVLWWVEDRRYRIVFVCRGYGGFFGLVFRREILDYRGFDFVFDIGF